jgi:hypothetical protein
MTCDEGNDEGDREVRQRGEEITDRGRGAGAKKALFAKTEASGAVSASRRHEKNRKKKSESYPWMD